MTRCRALPYDATASRCAAKIIRSQMAAVVLSALFLNGCLFSINGEPRPRLGSYATSTPGTNFIDIHNLGNHSYGNCLFENNGIVYTCRAGHIDIAHLRINADYVKYLYTKVKKNLIHDKSELTFKLNVEPSWYFVKFYYPKNWAALPSGEKETLAHQFALELSQYFTFNMTIWHEFLTFYGYKCMAVLPEEPSAFSWEDIYSNLVGIRLGAQAVADEESGYDKSMTLLLNKELESLGIQSSQTAREVSEKMRGTWFNGFVLVNMVERNMDIGLDDGLVTPVLVPGVCENAEPQSYPIPMLEAFHQYGFTMSFEVEPAEFEKNQLLRIVYPNGDGKRIQFPYHLPLIMDYTKKEAIRRGYIVNPPLQNQN